MMRPIPLTLFALILLSDLASAQTPTPLGAEFQINTYTTDSQGIPAVSLDGAGGFVVVWYSYGSSGTDSSLNSIQGQRFASDGAPSGGEFQVNTYTTSRQNLSAVSSDGAGGFVVAWQSNGSVGTDDSYYYSVQGQRFASDGTPAGGQFQVNTYTTRRQHAPEVSPDGGGGFIVVWSSSGSSGTDSSRSSVQGQRFASDGSPQGGEFQINTYTPGFQGGRTAVSSDGAGGFVVVWISFDYSYTEIKGQRFASDGSFKGGEFKVNTYATGFGPSFAVSPNASGGFVVVWSSDEDILPPPPPPDGTLPPSTAFATRRREPATKRRYPSLPSVSSGPSIEAQRFGSDGSPIGSQFQLNSFTASRMFNTEVSPDGAGGFVVVWQNSGSSGSASASSPPYLWTIQGRRFASDGTPEGDQFQVNTYTTDDQRVPAVSPDGAGGFVVVWDSVGYIGTGTDSSYGSIRGQRYALSTGCTPDDDTLCMLNDRFKLEVDWRTADNNTGVGRVVTTSNESGLLHFFGSSNWEILVKMVDACNSPFNSFWVFAAATTDVEYTLTVTDTQTNTVNTYFNPLGNAAAAITDSSAFATCP